MRKMMTALALCALVAACGEDGADKGPTQEEMKAAASRLLQVPEDKITEFTKQKCRAQDEGFVCGFEMYITFVDTPSKQDLDKGYFYKSGEEWRMELVG